MQYILPALIIAAAIIGAVVVLHRLLSSKSAAAGDESLTLLQNQLTAGLAQTAQQMGELRQTLNESVQSMSGQVSRNLNETTRSMGARMDNTQKVIGDVREQLGRLRESSKRMIEVGQDISRLEQILSPPKLRGALGEFFLADILAQIFPPEYYRLQHRFKGGETVDAVVILKAGMVPIDAKFPLENFRRIIEAEDEENRKAARKAFLRDVKGHIDTIAAKYIRMDENTFDFALMYVPAENVYYETIINDREFGSDLRLFNYALSKRVIPVSPNSFYAYLQTIVLGLKGMHVESKSREIIEGLSRLGTEFARFEDAFRLVGQHLENSSKKYMDAEKRLGRVEAKVEQIGGLAQGLELEQPGEHGVDQIPAGSASS